ncbi:MAG: archaellin/type IV pilin N-terminal domain-containing protein [Nanoarchaeota archaeon]|nr:hypothetical protein [Nanoarchaeota archaeon]MBU1444711.1 hypothetical protein [Nanoarchaeota archaeon]MBU2406852.1 hypothetical protein [Nanoarchaeota archaeon]MBU2420563.1 hypothetical protein [Nanoarchaeota archaeon]MBU2475786.1 hypothetical protein [Nanoarchaeota archaeon]
MKKGISPLIVSVILIGCVIALAAFMFSSISGSTKGTLDTVGEWQSSSRLIDFKVESKGDCNLEEHEQIGDGTENCYTLLIENQMDEEISYVVRTIMGGEVQIAETEPFAPYVSKFIDVNFDSVAGEEMTAEVIPVSYE